MHDKGKGIEKLTSIPRLMEGTSNSDHEEWLNFIMEASGTSDAANELKVRISVFTFFILNETTNSD